MYCPKCNKWNEPGYRFCAGCGTSLAGASTEVPPALKEIQQLRQLLDQNYNSLHKIDQRLAALEKGMPIPAAAPEEKVTPTPQKAGIIQDILNEYAKPYIEPEVEQREPPPPEPEKVEAPAETKPAKASR